MGGALKRERSRMHFFRLLIVATSVCVGIAGCAGGSGDSGDSKSNTTTPPTNDTTPPTVSITAPANGITVSGVVSVSASATDNVGVAGVQFRLNGGNLGAEDTTPGYSISWDTRAVSNGNYTLTAVARDTSNNVATASAVSITVNNTGAPPPPPPPTTAANIIVVTDQSGTTQTNRAISVARPFRQGEIAQYVQAAVDGVTVLTQTDVKNRWPDNSVKFAIVSFVIPSLSANGSVEVSFSNQPVGNNSGYLNAADMLAANFDFDAGIDMTGATAQSVSARQMLQNGHFRYWLQGPIVTAVIIEDRTAARTYDKDFGDGSKALHPVFEAWFYPQGNHVEVGYTVENIWASSTVSKSMRDLSYSLALWSGNSVHVPEFSHTNFNHVGRTRWQKRFWVGDGTREPGAIHIDHNTKYLVTTRAIANYDTTLDRNGLLNQVSARYNDWLSTDKSIDGTSTSIGSFDKALAAGGGHPWIGLMNTWDILYLLTMDDRAREMMLGNAELAGRIPWYYREADSLAGSGDYFDAPTPSGSIDTFGRPISVNARRTVTLSDLPVGAGACGSEYAADQINLGTTSADGWTDYNLGRHHMPDVGYAAYLMSGRYFYLEQLQLQAAYTIAWKIGCYTLNYPRQGHNGYFNDSEVRGDAWSYRTLIYAAFISPDGTPEKAYFEDKLLNNIAKDEGSHNLTLSVPSKQSHWDWGHANQMFVGGPSPLGLWSAGNSGLVSPPVVTNGTVAQATSPWMEHFVLSALGMGRDMGFPTDNMLKFMAKHLFNQVLNPATSPILIEGYRTASILTATNNWIQTWADVNQYHSIPSGWQIGQDVDHGYGFIALGVSSFLYPYSVDGFTGVQAWGYLKSAKPEQDRFATESPKWAIVPR